MSTHHICEVIAASRFSFWRLKFAQMYFPCWHAASDAAALVRVKALRTKPKAEFETNISGCIFFNFFKGNYIKSNFIFS